MSEVARTGPTGKTPPDFEFLAIQAVADDYRSRGLTSQAAALEHDGWIHLEHLKKLRIQYTDDVAKCESTLDEYVVMRRVSDAPQNDMAGFDKAYPAVLRVRLAPGQQADSTVLRVDPRKPRPRYVYGQEST